ncbi:MAG: ATP-binding cassette domain-containing protein [Lachnospiraceae bacterium]|nr:ATP-binding cassette domain-containing protein [Lachnospiraceae bacterium]
MIEIQHLTKVYKLNKKQMLEQKTKDNTKVAVRDLSVSIQPGEIYGLLGPNGAGKTTTLRCIATLLKPTQGEVSVGGCDTVHESAGVRRQIGFLTNDIKLDPQFTPAYLIRFFGQLHGMNDADIERRKNDLFTYFGIHEFADKKVDELSTGMKQKAAIAVSLVHDPEVIIFDEPTSGLDIITARGVTDYLKHLRDQGKCIVISTHIMSEAEKLCDRIGIIIDGSKVCEGTLPEILASTGTDDLEDAFFRLYSDHHVEEMMGGVHA